MTQEQRVNRVLALRLVDVSFESPNKVSLANSMGRDEVPVVTVKNDGPVVTKVNDQGVYDVRLGVNVSCDFEDKTNIFIAEAKMQATVVVADENDFASQIFLNGTVADMIYNNLREVINDLVTSGGFPEFQLQFLVYEQKYMLDNADKLNLAAQQAQ